MISWRTLAALTLAVAALFHCPALQAKGVVYEVDPAASTIEVNTARAGLLGSAGHAHHVVARGFSGRIVLDAAEPARSSVELSIRTTSLDVEDRGVSDADQAEIQRTMESARVLDVARFPEIRFASRRVQTAAQPGGHHRVEVDGRLELHGVGRDIRVVGDVSVSGERLVASGAVKLAQRDFGIKPYSALFGTIRVANEVEIRFALTARASSRGR